MKKLKINGEIWTNDDLFFDIEENLGFREHVGKCLTHFLHFVVPRRDNDYDIEQDYSIPDDFGLIESSLLIRRERGNKIFISYTRW